MPKIDVINQKGVKVEELSVSKSVLEAKISEDAVYRVIKAYNAGLRQGTQKAKTRSEVRGGGKKPWRQKGTGRARQGSIRAPQWVGGGVVFPPTPRSYQEKVNKKLVQCALRSILSDRFKENRIIVIDDIKCEAKTKDFVKIIQKLKIKSKMILVLEGSIFDEGNYELYLASRNIPNVYVQSRNHVNAYDLLWADKIVLTKPALLKYEEELK